MRHLLLFALLLLRGPSLCGQPQPTGAMHRERPTYLYKTRHDYRRLVPVLLSPDKATIIAYPGPADLYANGKLALPTPLAKGYLLDNRGIGPNVAFLDITYQDYAKRTDALPLDELMRHLLDKDPLLALYDCGPRLPSRNLVASLNSAIRAKRLHTFRQLK